MAKFVYGIESLRDGGDYADYFEFDVDEDLFATLELAEAKVKQLNDRAEQRHIERQQEELVRRLKSYQEDKIAHEALQKAGLRTWDFTQREPKLTDRPYLPKFQVFGPIEVHC